MKKLIIVVVILGGGVVVWYLLSPLWTSNELNEPSPLDTPTPIEVVKVEEPEETFEEAMNKMKDEKIIMADDMSPEATVVSNGDFTDGEHHVQGTAWLITQDETTTLRFEDFETLNGPNLHIYLATDLEASDYIDLGKIRATHGNVNYEVDSSVDTEKYNKVLVWCVPFKVLFGSAELE